MNASLMPALRGEKMAPRRLYFEHEGARGVRDGRYKVTAVKGGPWQLYDMESDRTELQDLASKRPEIVAALSKEWDAWASANQVVPNRACKCSTIACINGAAPVTPETPRMGDPSKFPTHTPTVNSGVNAIAQLSR